MHLWVTLRSAAAAAPVIFLVGFLPRSIAGTTECDGNRRSSAGRGPGRHAPASRRMVLGVPPHAPVDRTAWITRLAPRGSAIRREGPWETALSLAADALFPHAGICCCAPTLTPTECLKVSALVEHGCRHRNGT